MGRVSDGGGSTPSIIKTRQCSTVPSHARVGHVHPFGRTRLGGGREARSSSAGRRQALRACRVIEADDWCNRCGCPGVGDTVVRRSAHEPFG